MFRLKSGPNLIARIQLSTNLKPSVRSRVIAASTNLFFCFYRGRLLLERYAFCDLQVKTTTFFVLKVCFPMFELFKPDFELIFSSVRELPLV